MDPKPPRSTRAVLLLVGILILCIAGFIGSIAVQLDWMELRYLFASRYVGGIITGKSHQAPEPPPSRRVTDDPETVRQNARASANSERYWVYYKYMDRSRHLFTGRGDVSPVDYDRAAENGRIFIRYLESDPATSRPAAASLYGILAAIGLTLLTLLIAGLGLLCLRGKTTATEPEGN